MPRWIEDLYFSVELWSGERLEEVVARCSRPDLARAAYRVACQVFPKRLVMLCRSAQILERSDRRALDRFERQITVRFAIMMVIWVAAVYAIVKLM